MTADEPTEDQVASHYDETIHVIECPVCSHRVTVQALGAHLLTRQRRCLRVVVEGIVTLKGMYPGGRDLSPGFVGRR